MAKPVASSIRYHLVTLTSTLTKSFHGWMILAGLLIGLLYFPVWMRSLLIRALEGGVSWFLIIAMLGLAFNQIWQQRQSLQVMSAEEEDRYLGYALIWAGILAFPFCRFAIWPQSLAWLTVLIGIILSSWGAQFFARFKFSCILLALTVYPKLGVLSRTVWEFFFPTYFLENVMASSAVSALSLFGFAAKADDRFISFPEGTVEVGWGCNGIDMAITMALAGLFLGLIYRQDFPKITLIMLIAIVLALVANIPRLMLVTVAYVYWGKQWFVFWHGFWGGQLFAGFFSTLYFTVVMRFLKP